MYSNIIFLIIVIRIFYKKHSKDNGLISSYGTNINEAVRNRDKIALKSLKYMLSKIG